MQTIIVIIGHHKIVDFFENAIKEGSLAHTYCFVGPDQVGKRVVAKHIAAELLATGGKRLESHPDFYYIARVEDEKTGKLKKELSVAQAREMRARLQLKSWFGGYQVMLIDEAELLNEESANALLKILEEPPEKSLIILLTENDFALPATVRSRCQCFYFSLVPEREIVESLLKNGYAAATAALSAKLAWGRPGRAITLAENAEALSVSEGEVKRFQKLLGVPFYSKLKLIEEIFGDKDDAVRGRERLQNILDIWILEWRQLLLFKNNSAGNKENGAWLEREARRFSQSALREIIDLLVEAKTLLGRNIHPRLLVERVLLNF